MSFRFVFTGMESLSAQQNLRLAANIINQSVVS